MASTDEIEVEGVTTFAVTPKTSYRYALKLKNDKLSIWVEDQTSKKQWYKGEMAKDDYVIPDNTISNASAMDYLKCFQDSLDGKDEFNDVLCTLEMLEEGALRVVFNFKFRFHRLARVTKFEFVLEPVSVKRIDLLESQLRDKQDELERHRGELKRLCGDVSAHVKLTASTKDAATSYLLWRDIESVNFTANSETGEVSTLCPGIYSITAVVLDPTPRQQRAVDLMVNGMSILRNQLYSNGYNNISTTTGVKANDILAVKCDYNVQEAFLSIAYLRCS